MCVCVYLSKEFLHQTVSPAVVQRPGFGRVTDVCSVKHQRQHFHFVYTGGRDGEQEQTVNIQQLNYIKSGLSKACMKV